MALQKICIIGDGLSGLTTAVMLSSGSINIDLFSKRNKSTKIDQRTTAISESNYFFLKDELSLKNIKYIHPCENINLYYEHNQNYINFLNLNNKKKNLMYIFENHKLKQSLLKAASRKKNIRLINKNINSFDVNDGSILVNGKKTKYDLIILSVGNQSTLYKKIGKDRSIRKNYNEKAITAIIKHNLNISNASQYFLKEGPLAILPIKKNLSSLIWSVNNNFFENYKYDLKNILEEKVKKILKNKIKISIHNIQSFPIHLNIRTKYSNKNILILGDGLHSIHPMAGQGFNLVLRDIKKLRDLIKKDIKLGLSIKSSNILKDFYYARSPENTLLSLGVDLTNSFIKDDTFFTPIRNKILNKIHKFDFIKKLSREISDKGISA